MTEPAPQEPRGPARRLSRRLARGAATFAYRLVRPVARPLAWRLRRFLTAEIMTELGDARTRQEAALQRLDALVQRPANTVLDAVGPDPQFAEAMERLLLTLALEDSARLDPPGLSNTPGGG